MSSRHCNKHCRSVRRNRTNNSQSHELSNFSNGMDALESKSFKCKPAVKISASDQEICGVYRDTHIQSDESCGSVRRKRDNSQSQGLLNLSNRINALDNKSFKYKPAVKISASDREVCRFYRHADTQSDRITPKSEIKDCFVPLCRIPKSLDRNYNTHIATFVCNTSRDKRSERRMHGANFSGLQRTKCSPNIRNSTNRKLLTSIKTGSNSVSGKLLKIEDKIKLASLHDTYVRRSLRFKTATSEKSRSSPHEGNERNWSSSNGSVVTTNGKYEQSSTEMKIENERNDNILPTKLLEIHYSTKDNNDDVILVEDDDVIEYPSCNKQKKITISGQHSTHQKENGTLLNNIQHTYTDKNVTDFRYSCNSQRKKLIRRTKNNLEILKVIEDINPSMTYEDTQLVTNGFFFRRDSSTSQKRSGYCRQNDRHGCAMKRHFDAEFSSEVIDLSDGETNTSESISTTPRRGTHMKHYLKDASVEKPRNCRNTLKMHLLKKRINKFIAVDSIQIVSVPDKTLEDGCNEADKSSNNNISSMFVRGNLALQKHLDKLSVTSPANCVLDKGSFGVFNDFVDDVPTEPSIQEKMPRRGTFLKYYLKDVAPNSNAKPFNLVMKPNTASQSVCSEDSGIKSDSAIQGICKDVKMAKGLLEECMSDDLQVPKEAMYGSIEGGLCAPVKDLCTEEFNQSETTSGTGNKSSSRSDTVQDNIGSSLTAQLNSMEQFPDSKELSLPMNTNPFDMSNGLNLIDDLILEVVRDLMDAVCTSFSSTSWVDSGNSVLGENKDSVFSRVRLDTSDSSSVSECLNSVVDVVCQSNGIDHEMTLNCVELVLDTANIEVGGSGESAEPMPSSTIDVGCNAAHVDCQTRENVGNVTDQEYKKSLVNCEEVVLDEVTGVVSVGGREMHWHCSKDGVQDGESAKRMEPALSASCIEQINKELNRSFPEIPVLKIVRQNERENSSMEMKDKATLSKNSQFLVILPQSVRSESKLKVFPNVVGSPFDDRSKHFAITKSNRSTFFRQPHQRLKISENVQKNNKTVLGKCRTIKISPSTISTKMNDADNTSQQSNRPASTKATEIRAKLDMGCVLLPYSLLAPIKLTTILEALLPRLADELGVFHMETKIGYLVLGSKLVLIETLHIFYEFVKDTMKVNQVSCADDNPAMFSQNRAPDTRDPIAFMYANNGNDYFDYPNDFSPKVEENVRVSKTSFIKEFKCSVCCKEFDCNSLLYDHASIHQTLYTCEKCAAPYKTKTELASHEEKHLFHPFVCCYCTFSSKASNSLRAHMESEHDLVFCYTCDHCPVTFRSKKTYKNHMLVPHRTTIDCQFCSTKFDTISLMVKHLDIQHWASISSQPQLCAICGQDSGSRSMYVEHLKEKHDMGKFFPCRKCPLFFETIDLLQKHVQWRHCLNSVALEPKILIDLTEPETEPSPRQAS